MNNRRKFLAAGGAAAVMSTLPTANADPRGFSIYLHGMVWNRQLPAPMNDWLIKLDAKADFPNGSGSPSVTPGLATLGDDLHDGPGSHVEIQSAILHGNQLTMLGVVNTSKDPSMTGQTVKIEGRVSGTSIEGLTVTINGVVFTGAGLLVVIAIIAILIG